MDQFRSLEVKYPFLLVAILTLSFANWGLELLKWREILRINKIDYSFREITSSLLSGVTTGLVTPNRIGNFIGRMLFFKGKVRAYLTLGTLYSNFAQFLVTVLFGVFSFLFLHDVILVNYGVLVLYISFFFLALSLLFYFGIPYFPVHRVRLFRRKQNVLREFQRQSKETSFSIFLLSAGRYLAFSIQYYLFLVAFGAEPTFSLFNGILLFYLITTLIPSVFLGKLVIRETTGLIVLSFFVDNGAVIVLSSLLLWFVNLGLPSLIGLVLILKRKHFADA